MKTIEGFLKLEENVLDSAALSRIRGGRTSGTDSGEEKKAEEEKKEEDEKKQEEPRRWIYVRPSQMLLPD